MKYIGTPELLLFFNGIIVNDRILSIVRLFWILENALLLGQHGHSLLRQANKLK